MNNIMMNDKNELSKRFLLAKYEEAKPTNESPTRAYENIFDTYSPAGNVIKTKRILYITMMVIAFVATYFLDVSAMVVIIVCLLIGLIDLAVTMGKKGRLDR